MLGRWHRSEGSEDHCQCYHIDTYNTIKLRFLFFVQLRSSPEGISGRDADRRDQQVGILGRCVMDDVTYRRHGQKIECENWGKFADTV